MRHNKLKIYLHLVWSTWDRLPLIGEDIERDLYRFVTAVSQDMGCTLLAIGGMPDHIHVLLTLPTTRTIADVVERFKGGSSNHVNDCLRPGQFFKWQGHYGAFTVSPHDKDTVTNYILNQKTHHTEHRLWPSVGATYDNN